MECKKPALDKVYNPAGIILSWIMYMMIPVLQLVFVINCGKLKEKFDKIGKSMSSRTISVGVSTCG